VVSLGDRREDIFADDRDRENFLSLLGRSCMKTGWQVHAYCLMTNHWHAVVETPQPNLAAGMRWLLATYTQSFNRRHQQWGHLFGGRYKAQVIDCRSRGYLAQACNYVHLNPRPGVHAQGRSETGELSVERCRGYRDRMQSFAPRMEDGSEDFADWLGDKLVAERKRAETRREKEREVDEILAERLARDCLRAVGWSVDQLRRSPKGDPVKVGIARHLRAQTPVSGYLSNLLRHDDVKF
jgi:REP element-mobilizing transposase RayT